MWLLADFTSNAMFLLGVALLIAILFRRAYRYQRRRPAKPSSPHNAAARSRPAEPLIDAPPEIVRWQVQMHQTARDLKAELDSKMSALQALIAMASREAERLEALLAVDSTPRRAAQPDRAEPGEPSDPDLARGPQNQTLSSVARVDPAEGAPDRRREIYQLADRGESPRSIADQLGAPVGDVEFILSLRGADR